MAADFDGSTAGSVLGDEGGDARHHIMPALVTTRGGLDLSVMREVVGLLLTATLPLMLVGGFDDRIHGRRYLFTARQAHRNRIPMIGEQVAHLAAWGGCVKRTLQAVAIRKRTGQNTFHIKNDGSQVLVVVTLLQKAQSTFGLVGCSVSQLCG